MSNRFPIAARTGSRSVLVLLVLVAAGYYAGGNLDPDPIAHAGQSVAHVLGLNEDGLIIGEGGAFVFREDGYLLTRYHFVMYADTVAVLLPGRAELNGKVVAGDKLSDLAIIKIDPPEPLPALSLVDQPAYGIGDEVVALGVRRWRETEVAAGRIVAEDGRKLGIAEYEPLIIADADGDIGSAGGPLLNERGGLIGIIAATHTRWNRPYRDKPAFYALPAEQAARIAGRLLRGGENLWTEVPFEAGLMTPEVKDLYRVPFDYAWIRNVQSPRGADFEAAGYVVGFDGRPLDGTDAWLRRLWTAPAGTTLGFRLAPDVDRPRDIVAAEHATVSFTITEDIEGSMARPCPACDAAITPLGLAVASSAPAVEHDTLEPDVPDAVREASRAIARIVALDPVLGRVQTSGSALCIRADGYFITAAHLVPDGMEARIELPGRVELAADVVARDEATDLAVVKADTESPLPAISLRRPPEVRRGQRLWAAAMPDGLEVEFAPGHVFGVNVLDRFPSMKFEELIIADNEIRRGYSGGPLLTGDGELAGMILAAMANDIAAPDEVRRTYALTATLAAAIAGRLLADDLPLWTESGVAWHLPSSYHTMVNTRDWVPVGMTLQGDGDSMVVSASALAERSGFSGHDRVLSVNGVPVRPTDEWRRLLLRAPAGSQLRFRVLREDVPPTLTLGERRGLHITRHEIEVIVEVTPEMAGSMSRPCPRCDEVLRTPQKSSHKHGEGQ